MGKRNCISEPEKISKIGQNIKKARISVGLKQNEMAQKIGVSPNFLCMLETGKRSPSLYILRKISFIAGMSMDELLGDKDQEEGLGGGYDDDINSYIRQLRENYHPDEIRRALKFARERLENGE